jgi:hypothetical protein
MNKIPTKYNLSILEIFAQSLKRKSTTWIAEKKWSNSKADNPNKKYLSKRYSAEVILVNMQSYVISNGFFIEKLLSMLA